MTNETATYSIKDCFASIIVAELGRVYTIEEIERLRDLALNGMSAQESEFCCGDKEHQEAAREQEDVSAFFDWAIQLSLKCLRIVPEEQITKS